MSSSLRRVWLGGTIALTLLAFAASIALAPPAGASAGRGLVALLFIGSSAHVASTAWFYAVPEVRTFARARPGRYVWAPLGLVAGSAVMAALVAPDAFSWVLPPYFAWQFFHFQKQNVGLAALASVAGSSGSVTPWERTAITAAGVAGTVALLAHPHLLDVDHDLRLDVLFPAAAVVFAAAVLAGLVALRRRDPADRPPAFLAVYGLSLLFFLPVFLFDSPYAAVAGLTMAHGFQYLLLVGLVAGGEPRGERRLLGFAVLFNAAVLGGVALAASSHLHDAGPAARSLYGAYLGVVMAHFVIDAGLWRFRDEFPRRFLTAHLPYLLVPAPRAADRGR